jgi:MFS family permease
MWFAVAGIAVLYVCSTLPTPLYPLYQRQFGFSELMVTAIYASYVIGNLAVLCVLGRLSDQLGRRPASLIAFGILIASTLCLLAAQATAWLFMGRVLNGIAAGLGAGTLTAWIAELEPSHDRGRAALTATAGNLAGLAFGPLLAGPLAQYAPWPLRTSYWLYLLILLLMMALLRRLPECVEHPVRRLGDLSLRPRISVPREIRVPFISPAAMAFAMFALGGFYGALTPGLLSTGLKQSNLAVIGTVVALFFGIGALTAALSGRLRDRSAMLLATVLLLTGLALLLLAEQWRSMPCLLIATAISGAAMALGYRCSLGMVNVIAPPAQRAEVVSAYLLCCYTANSLPVIGVGLLSQIMSHSAAHLLFAALLAVFAITACAVGWRYAPQRDLVVVAHSHH